MKSVLITLFSLTLVAYSDNLAGQSIQNTTHNPEIALTTIIGQKKSEVGICTTNIVDKEVVWTKGFCYTNKDTKTSK